MKIRSHPIAQNMNGKFEKFCPECLGQNFSNFSVHILGNATTSYFHSEISWPLGSSKQLILECYLLTLQVCNMYITQQPTITCGNDSENLDTNHFQSQKFTEFDNISVFLFYIWSGFLGYSRTELNAIYNYTLKSHCF